LHPFGRKLILGNKKPTELQNDQGFKSVLKSPLSPSRASEFLKDFTSVQLRQIQDVLINTSFKLRKVLNVKSDFHLILDSTKHQQFGEHQEGVEWNYTEYKALDSFQAYDELGLSYWFDVRPGRTYTATGAEEVVYAVLSKLSAKAKKFVLADSGFYSTDFFNACAMQNAKFIVAMRSNVYGPLLNRNLNWKSAGEMKFFDGRKFEYAESLIQHKGGIQTNRVVIVRALKASDDAKLFDEYDYAAFITNIGQHELSAKEVLKKYRKRSNGENFIREMKNGVNVRRFQCRRLVSNGAWGLAAAFAHTYLHFLGHVSKDKVVHFAKKLRNKFIFLPAQVVRHGREICFRFHTTIYREVKKLEEKLHIKFTVDSVTAEMDPRFLTS